MNIEILTERGSSTPESLEFLERLEALCDEFDVFLVQSPFGADPSGGRIHALHSHGSYEFTEVRTKRMRDASV